MKNILPAIIGIVLVIFFLPILLSILKFVLMVIFNSILYVVVLFVIAIAFIIIGDLFNKKNRNDYS
jgi:hypothetical protein